MGKAPFYWQLNVVVVGSKVSWQLDNQMNSICLQNFSCCKTNLTTVETICRFVKSTK